jgi:hypothetical protein
VIVVGGTVSEPVLVSLICIVASDFGVVNQMSLSNKRSSAVFVVKEQDWEETFSVVEWLCVPNHGFKLIQKILTPRSDLSIILYFVNTFISYYLKSLLLNKMNPVKKHFL